MAVSKGLAIERKFLNELAQQKFDKAKKKTLGSLDNANRTYLSQLLEQEDLINAQRNFFLNSFDTSLNELRRQVYTAQRASRDRQAITGIYDDFAQVRDNNILNEEIDYQISNLLQTSMGNALNVASQQQANLRSQVQATYQGLIENERDEAIENGTATIDHGKQFMKFLSGALSGALTATFGVGLLKGGYSTAAFLAQAVGTGIANRGINKAVKAQNAINNSLIELQKNNQSLIDLQRQNGGRFQLPITSAELNELVKQQQIVDNFINNPRRAEMLSKIDKKIATHRKNFKAKFPFIGAASGSAVKATTNAAATTTVKAGAEKVSQQLYRLNRTGVNKFQVSRVAEPLANSRLAGWGGRLLRGWGFYAAIAGAIIGGIINTTKTTSYMINQASLDALKQSSAWKSLADIGGFSVDDIASSLGDSVKNYQKTNRKWPWIEQ